MSSAILITVNLPGRIGGMVAHQTRQSSTVDVTPEGSKHKLLCTKEIIHTDRTESSCFRSTFINEEVVKSWESNECPSFVKSKVWEKLNKRQRSLCYIKRFDEGFGVSYEFID